MVNITKEQDRIVEELLEQQTVEKKLAKKAKADQPRKTGQKIRWRPADRIPEYKAPEGFRLKLAANTPERVRQLMHEGWQVANRLEHNIDTDMDSYYKKINDSSSSEKSSVITHNELIAMIIPEEKAVAREEYYKDLTERRTRAKFKPEENTQNADIARRAQVKTTITIN